jgi:ATP-binding cassette subfamily F protein 3
MLRNLATKLVIFHNGNAEFFNGTYDEFLEKIGWESEESKPNKTLKRKMTEKEIKQRKSEIVIERAKLTKPLNEEIVKLENDIGKNEDLLKRISGELEKATMANDTAKLTDYAHAVGKLNHLIDTLFEQLSEVNENLDSIQKQYDNELATLDS